MILAKLGPHYLPFSGTLSCSVLFERVYVKRMFTYLFHLKESMAN